MEIRYTSVTPSLVEGEASDPGSTYIVTVELHQAKAAADISSSTLIASQQADKTVSGVTAGHGFSFSLSGTRVKAGDYVAISASSQSGKWRKIVYPNPVQ